MAPNGVAIQTKSFDILNRETGERVRVTFEQQMAPTIAHPSRYDTFDMLVDEFMHEGVVLEDSNLDALEVK